MNNSASRGLAFVPAKNQNAPKARANGTSPLARSGDAVLQLQPHRHQGIGAA